ncbi:MAG: hypothetical protein SXG53_23520, partial [Pseudomonadota bacterium]|nr:hypothetical protein [Pseudomonadota bacterium]
MTLDTGESPGHRAWGWLYLFCAILTGLLGAGMAALGAYIVVLGGTFYYLLTGLLLVAGALLAVLRRHRWALIAFGAGVLLTLIWSVVEIGGKGWMPAWGVDLAARLGVITVLVAATALAFLFWQTPPRSRGRRGAVAAVSAAIAGLAIIVGFHWERVEDRAVAETAVPSPTTAIHDLHRESWPLS